MMMPIRSRCKRNALAVVLALPGLSGVALAQDWSQWGRNPGHSGTATAIAQPLEAILADIVYDPFVEAEKAEADGELVVHYAVPLVDGADVYMTFKTGSYVPCDPPGSGQPIPCGPEAWSTQVWNVKKLHWDAGVLHEVWTFQSDWKPEPVDLAVWEPVFLPALAGGFLYVPGLGGTVFRVSLATGSRLERINPFSDINPSLFVAGGLAAGADGSVVYNVIGLQSDPVGQDVSGAWLVRIAPDHTATSATFASLTGGAPAATDMCEGTFAVTDLPWPPSPSAVPTPRVCGSQRPGLNVVPAIGADGTIYTVSRAHFVDRYGYLVAAHPDLTPAWTASLRGVLADGCGVTIPPSGTPGGCRSGATAGVDPQTNAPPAGRVTDLASSSPVVLPDGAILYGSYTRYNGSQGHLFKFSPLGEVLATYPFGWDITPAVRPRSGSYSVVLKENHYGLGSYCGDPDICPSSTPSYLIVSLDPSLSQEWAFTSTNDQECERQPNGTVDCVPAGPNGFEWCVNQPAVDGAGVTLVNSEDGGVYAIRPDGTLAGSLFLDTALGAAYTPLSIGGDGIVYTQNNGHLFAVGALPAAKEPRETPEHPAPENRETRVLERH